MMDGNRKSRRRLPHRFEACGYVVIRNTDADDGLWRVGGKRQAVYAKREMSHRDQLAAAAILTSAGYPGPPAAC
jgi:hypothetical protein